MSAVNSLIYFYLMMRRIQTADLCNLVSEATTVGR